MQSDEESLRRRLKTIKRSSSDRPTSRENSQNVLNNFQSNSKQFLSKLSLAQRFPVEIFKTAAKCWFTAIWSFTRLLNCSSRFAGKKPEIHT